MTQVSRAQDSSAQVALRSPQSADTFAALRARLDHQAREALLDAAMAAEHLEEIKQRLKALRKQTRLKQYDAAREAKIPPRTFQSWENGEVETDREGYEQLAKFYSRKLGRKITVNYILFGQEDAPAPTPDPFAPTELAELSAAVDELRRELRATRTELLSEIGKARTAREAPQRSQERGSRSGAGS